MNAEHPARPIRTVVDPALGLLGSASVLILLWLLLLSPLGWPSLTDIARYFLASIASVDTYKSLLATGLKAVIGALAGFSSAVLLAVITGRTRLGWILFFFLLLFFQKIPAVAMVYVFVSSKLGIGLLTTVSLAAIVVLTFTWLVLHHRASTLDPQEVFALRVAGFRGWRLAAYGLLPHLGSAIGGSLRLAISIAIVMVIIGEWQGVWSDGSLWSYGLGISISRSYDAVNSQARVLASCIWLGILGFILDGLAQLTLIVIRFFSGLDLRR